MLEILAAVAAPPSPVTGAAAQEACDNLLAKGILPHAAPALCGAGAGLGVADLLFWIAWWLPF